MGIKRLSHHALHCPGLGECHGTGIARACCWMAMCHANTVLRIWGVSGNLSQESQEQREPHECINYSTCKLTFMFLAHLISNPGSPH